MKKLSLCLILIISAWENKAAKCQSGQECVPFTECQMTRNGSLFYPCNGDYNSTINNVCCSSNSIRKEGANLKKRAPFPSNCGLVVTNDKISGGQTADLGQFPWMALLGYKQKGLTDFTQFLCGGSLITEYHVLTAAHCIFLDQSLNLSIVRLGEHDLTKSRDCIKYDDGEEVCANPTVEYQIAESIRHQKYNDQNLKNDIALIKTQKLITFTEFIKPICLPFGRNLDGASLAKQKFQVSGWGKTQATNVGGSTVLQFATVKVWDQSTCDRNVPAEVKPIDKQQLCANGPKTEDACKGDSGGPLFNATLDQDREVRYFQVGVVSFASTRTCGHPELPTVYTRVDQYLEWILNTVT